MNAETSRRSCLVGILASFFFSLPALAGADDKYTLPAPTGQFLVGRTQFEWTDKARVDHLSPSGYRQIVVWIWYPASQKSNTRIAKWMPGKWAGTFWSIILKNHPKMAQSFPHDPIEEIKANSFEDAQVVSGPERFPVLLFEPGLGVSPLSYTSLIENIASHGYVVVDIDPTYYTEMAVFSGDRIVTQQLTRMPVPPLKLSSEPGSSQAVHMGGQRFYTASADKDAQSRIDKYETAVEAAFPLWTGDMVFALAQVGKLNAAAGRFSNRLDLTKVGAFGHSFGGAASLEVAKENASVLAAVDIDGRLFGSVTHASLAKPVMIMKSGLIGQPRTRYWDSIMRSVIRTGKPGYLVSLNGTTHGFSSDLAFMSSEVGWNSTKEAGETFAPRQALKVAGRYLVAFFDTYLKGRVSSPFKPTRPSSSFITVEGGG